MENRALLEKKVQLLKEKRDREKYERLYFYYPDETITDFNTEVAPDGNIYARNLYAKHLDFFNASLMFRQIIFMAGNRVGKSFAGLYAAVIHATGLYPTWWTGRKWNRPIKIWLAATTKQKSQETLVKTLIGSKADLGSGMIPRHLLDAKNVISMAGISEGVYIIRVPHVSGGLSEITIKSYQEGREGFAGTAIDYVQLDESPPINIYLEALSRTSTTNGIVVVTFTPDEGLTETVLTFFKDGIVQPGAQGYKYSIVCDVDDVPHISEEAKREMWDACPPHLRMAKLRGLPYLGAGAVYPVYEDEFTESSHKHPEHVEYAFGMDDGWNVTAATFGYYDTHTDTWHIYDEYCGQHLTPSENAVRIRIKTKGWIEGIIDKASKQTMKTDGNKTYELYIQHGVSVYPSVGGTTVESGIQEVYDRLRTGRLKISKNCVGLLAEMRVYRRDEKGRLVGPDHHLDALRYLITLGRPISRTTPSVDEDEFYSGISNANPETLSGY